MLTVNLHARGGRVKQEGGHCRKIEDTMAFLPCGLPFSFVSPWSEFLAIIIPAQMGIQNTPHLTIIYLDFHFRENAEN